MNGNAELLNFVYQNSQMGVDTISQLLDIVDDPEYKKVLDSQLNEYELINRSTRALLNDNGYEEKGISALDKARTYLSLNVQTLTDKSPSHVSEMLIIGSNMGVINAVKNMKKYKNAEQPILDQMDKLLKFEESNIQQLKTFL